MMNKVNYCHVFHVISVAVLIESLFLALAIPVSVIFHEHLTWPLFKAFLITFSFSGIVFIITRKNENNISVRSSFMSVVLTWFFISLFGALPYLFTHSIPSVVNAFFESVSGFTTTGSSIINDIESMPKSVLFWRAETHWMGGMGIIVLVISILPYFKIGGQQMIMAEGSFVGSEKIKSRTVDVAKRLWFIYVLLTMGEIIALKFAGMNIFDAICHSFATVATGGFSTKNASIAAYSPAIHYVIIIFMILSGMNFTLHYLSFHKKFRKVFSNEELRVYLGIILIASLIIAVIIHSNWKIDWEKSFRDSLFQVSSILTATGFVSDDYGIWPDTAKFIILLIMLTGACAGSTGGGVKVARYVLLFKSLKQQVLKTIRPNMISVTRYNGQVYSDDNINGITSFVILYFGTIVLGTLIMTLTGLDKYTASSSVITTLGGIGPGFNLVGPVNNFSVISDVGKLYLSFNMILGRLEIMSVLVLLIPSFFKE